MEGLVWDQIPDDIKEEMELAESSEAESRLEAMWVTKEYQPLIDLLNAVEEENMRFKELCMQTLSELEDENMGDC